MLASPTPDYESLKMHRQHCEAARKLMRYPWIIDGILVIVTDIDSHYRKAVDSGATILTPPADEGVGRLYRAEDLEGHRWMFLQSKCG
jgi:uncharacterized glyoxalase superfamily protein PhnB